jgi:hypothetical protein
VHGDICSICCGTEREVTVACPLDCEYLKVARKHDKPVAIDPQQIPNRDIRVTEQMLEQNEVLVGFLGTVLVRAELDTPGAADADMREALGALVRTYRTLQSGVYYESLPTNPLAARIYEMVQRESAGFRRHETETGMSRTRDSDVLACLVFFERLELEYNNGRSKGRAFVSALMEFYGGGLSPSSPAGSSLIVP